jgi:hypothetical protein
MSSPIGGPVRAVFAGPVGSVVSSVLEPAGSAAGASPSPARLAGLIGEAFDTLFKRENRAVPVETCAQRPAPFAAPELPPAAIDEVNARIPAVAAQVASALNQISQGPAARAVQQLASSLGNSQPFTGPVAGAYETIATVGARIDQMLKDAERLMLGEKQEEQLKGYQMMTAALGMSNVISQVIRAQARMQRSLLAESSRRGLGPPKLRFSPAKVSDPFKFFR